MHWLEPGSEVNLPGGQGRQEVEALEPEPGLAFPGSHRVH